MTRVGRPKSVICPPCPLCQDDERVVAHGFRDVQGERRRSFRCRKCGRGFTPGTRPHGADPAVRAAVRRVRRETEVSYRVLSRALVRQLGISASHATVGAWCREDADGPEPEGTPCEYLSLLWALRQELADEWDQAG